MKRIGMLAAVVAATMVIGCTNMSAQQQGTVSGAAIGGVVGGVAGNIHGGRQ